MLNYLVLCFKTKNMANNSMPGYDACSYLLLLQMPHHVSESIREIKNWFSKKFDCEYSMLSKPHITLVSFVQYRIAEQKIIARLQSIANSTSPSYLQLRNFGSFPSHTIYINVHTKTWLQALVKEIRTETSRLLTLNSDNRPLFILEPHVTIARKLKPWQYEKGWLECSHLEYSTGFVAGEMLLLRKTPDKLHYEQVQSFALKTDAVITKQGSLFL